LITCTEMEKLVNYVNLVYAFLFFKENTKINKLPLEVQPLFDEFFDVVPKEIPHDLTPMRDIQHCIDFISGSMLPNKEAY